jgi:hypothetical protein
VTGASVQGRVGAKVLHREGGAAATGRLRLRVVDDREGGANHLLYEVYSGAFDHLEAAVVDHHLAAVLLEYAVGWECGVCGVWGVCGRCGGLGVWVCGCVGVWVCGCVGVCICGSVAEGRA